MKFDPCYFITIANRAGVDLTRLGKNKMRITSHGKPVSDVWVAVAKKHKRKLLRHLPDDQVKRLQCDLFEVCRLDAGDYFKRKRH
ncbi:hypothetical protein KFZ76_13725 [Methylovulum psychrotolerans]|uniref:hypothetical protein n=1 Tax=Methylovulum psychrotolerans TaxID=1704499 RepID=UPI001BFFD429|nr:hypothetical protein [Methylovulum psychrotolerans]MBT9098764.1 hypothetical protein [Methylovulum psychrotolerans]